MAARPSGSVLIVTNAKPRGWPVSRSVTTLISVTAPKLFEDMLKVSFSDGERNISNVEFHGVMGL